MRSILVFLVISVWKFVKCLYPHEVESQSTHIKFDSHCVHNSSTVCENPRSTQHMYQQSGVDSKNQKSNQHNSQQFQVFQKSRYLILVNLKLSDIMIMLYNILGLQTLADKLCACQIWRLTPVTGVRTFSAKWNSNLSSVLSNLKSSWPSLAIKMAGQHIVSIASTIWSLSVVFMLLMWSTRRRHDVMLSQGGATVSLYLGVLLHWNSVHLVNYKRHSMSPDKF